MEHALSILLIINVLEVIERNTVGFTWSDSSNHINEHLAQPSLLTLGISQYYLEVSVRLTP